jgi:hypothetical protein
MTVKFGETQTANTTALSVFPAQFFIPEANASIGGASFAPATFCQVPMDALAIGGVVSGVAVSYALEENP